MLTGYGKKHPQNLAIRMEIQLDPHSLFSNLDSSSQNVESITQCQVRIGRLLPVPSSLVEHLSLSRMMKICRHLLLGSPSISSRRLLGVRFQLVHYKKYADDRIGCPWAVQPSRQKQAFDRVYIFLFKFNRHTEIEDPFCNRFCLKKHFVDKSIGYISRTSFPPLMG